MEFFHLQDAFFLERVNRFLVQAKTCDNNVIALHLANSGRLREALVRGTRLRYRPHLRNKNYRTRGTIICAFPPNGPWIGLDARITPHIVLEAIQKEILSIPYSSVKSEPAILKRIRFDLLFETGSEKLWMEVKSITWVVKRTGLFPDAPTLRGQKHIEHLIRMKRNGLTCGICFVVQREDAQQVGIAKKVDPVFAELMEQAVDAGIQIWAIGCRVSESHIEPFRLLPYIGSYG